MTTTRAREIEEIGRVLAHQQRIETGTRLKPSAVMVPADRLTGDNPPTSFFGVPIMAGNRLALVYDVEPPKRDLREDLADVVRSLSGGAFTRPVYDSVEAILKVVREHKEDV